eukprot:CAMPEP_0119344518 /NCGR_PEP_ID=MMETSP1333-20130426/107012_1 /TAXON_ID=418940 /ORGANISM="Scyphosphaera apsteinii, Strain RCC1455" /LENGTH=149 /DNA_ID=CAMNT_0007356957 /DNA_START=263 /DNA_END=712 /DNA_ORIENTATION=-
MHHYRVSYCPIALNHLHETEGAVLYDSEASTHAMLEACRRQAKHERSSLSDGCIGSGDISSLAEGRPRERVRRMGIPSDGELRGTKFSTMSCGASPCSDAMPHGASPCFGARPFGVKPSDGTTKSDSNNVDTKSLSDGCKGSGGGMDKS